MRLHEAAPKLIIQEQLGDKKKVLSYCPVALLTRAMFALGQLHMASARESIHPCSPGMQDGKLPITFLAAGPIVVAPSCVLLQLN